MLIFLTFCLLQDLTIQSESFKTYYGYEETLDAGRLSVWENRDTKLRKISVAFLRFSSQKPSQKTPIYYLQGGPGSSGINVAKGNYFNLFKNLSQDRDVIVIDQRGTGRSEPNP